MGEGFATSVEGWVFAADAGFETLRDSWMALGAAKEMGEAYAGGVVGVCGLVPVFEEIFDGYATVW